MSKYITAVVAVALLLVASTAQAAPIVFDDFNVDEGRFNLAPNFSGTTVGELSTSTADRVTTDSVEGAGSQLLHLFHDTTTTAWRVRHLSGGGAPAGASGSPANTSFTTSAGEDGFIGFYVKTSDTGWTASINLDGAGNTAAEMDGSTAINLIADGDWHLYEWNLDSATDWGVVSGIGGGHGGALPDGSHTIDSIYFRNGTDPEATLLLDFVAKSDSGSIATLVPEPASLGLIALALPGMIRRRRR